MKWFRVYTEIKDDPKMLEMTFEQRWLWLCLLAMASENDKQRGVLTDVRLHGLAVALRTTDDVLSDALHMYGELGMAEYDPQARTITIIHWQERQFASDDGAARMRRHRAHKTRDVTVTSHVRNTCDDVAKCDALDTDTEYITTKVASSDDDGKIIASAASRKRKKTTRAPVDGDDVASTPTPTLTPSQAMFSALVDVCKLDGALNRGMLNKNAQQLLAAGYSADDVRVFAEWWVSNDWRREHRPVPNLTDLRNNILAARQTMLDAATPLGVAMTNIAFSTTHVED